jgi:hypothetical protein
MNKTRRFDDGIIYVSYNQIYRPTIGFDDQKNISREGQSIIQSNMWLGNEKLSK